MKKLIDAMATAYQEMAEKKMDPVGQADADIDNDGDVDKTDKYLHNRRKAIGKAMKKGKSSETATMNPKMDGGKSEQKESVKSADRKPEEYVGPDGKKRTRMVPVDREVIKKESTDMSIREKLMAVLEKKSHGNTDQKQPYDDNWSPGAKKMRDDNKDTGEYLDLEKKSHDDASAAGRVTKVSGKNPTDKNAKGDKNIVNPVKDTTKAGKGEPSVKESFSKTVKSIANAYQSMYEEVDMDYHMDKAADHRAQANYHSDKAKDHRDAGASDHAAHHMMAADMHKSAAKKHDKAADTGSQASSAAAKTLSRKADGKTAEVKKKFS